MFNTENSIKTYIKIDYIYTYIYIISLINSTFASIIRDCSSGSTNGSQKNEPPLFL